MAKPWTNSKGISVEIKPFSLDKNFKFRLLILRESLGGGLAEGEVRIKAEEMPVGEELFRSQNAIQIIIKQEEPVDSYTVNGFIVERDWDPGTGIMNFKFVCVPMVNGESKRDFFSTPRSMIYSGMSVKDIVQKIWGPDRVRFGTEAENAGTGSIDMYQIHETDSQFLEKLLYGYLKNSVFAFGIEGLLVKKICDRDRLHPDQIEPCRECLGGETAFSDNVVSAKYSPRLYKDILNPCLDSKEACPGEEISVNHQLELFDNEYRVFRKEYAEMQENWRHNYELLHSALYSTLIIKYTNSLPPWRLGDTFRYRKASEDNITNVDSFICTNNEIFISADPAFTTPEGFEFLVSSNIRGINSIDGKTLPDRSVDSDPGANEKLEDK